MSVCDNDGVPGCSRQHLFLELRTQLMVEDFSPSDSDASPSDRLVPSSEDWIRSRFPLLHEIEFSNVFLARFKQANPDFTSENSPASFSLRVSPEDPVYQSLLAEVTHDLAALVDISQVAGDGEPVAARSALVYIISHGGEPVIEDARATALGAALNAINQWSLQPELRNDALAHLSWLLGFGGDLSLTVRADLLDSFESCLQSGVTSISEVSACMQNAMELEMRMFDGSQERKDSLLRWINLCSKYAAPAICILLDVISDLSEDFDIRQAAKAVAYDLRGSVRRLWEDTIVDQVSPLESRAARLLEGRQRHYADPDMAQHVISQCKGEPIKDMNDPRLSQLLEVMRNGTERVRLAAARCLTECQMPEQPFAEVRESLYCVAEILVNAGDSRYVGDAIWILNNFRATNPHLASYADAAVSTATSKFLR